MHESSLRAGPFIFSTLLAVHAAAASFNSLANPSSDPSSRFGAEVRTLANGNIVVTDPVLTVNKISAAGAVYLFNGATGALISTLTGTAANEAVGGGGIGVLTNGNFVVFSNYGAVDPSHPGYASTFVNGTTGLNGVVSIENSLVQIPASGGSGQVGCVSASLMDESILSCQNTLQTLLTVDPSTSPLEAEGSPWSIGPPNVPNEWFTFVPLPTGNYLILSPGSGPGGAVTFGNGTTGVTGTISPGNSLMGATGDLIGTGWHPVNAEAQPRSYPATVPTWTPILQQGSNFFPSAFVNNDINNIGPVTIFANGDYLVESGLIGRVTLGSGVTGATGTIPTSQTFATSGGSIFALTNGNYVATTPAGVTLINGKTMTAINTLTVGSESVSSAVTPLSNGNYVVRNPNFGGNLGSATFVNGITGLDAAVSAANSLVGAVADDFVGASGVIALPNGNYVVLSQSFGGNKGAVTFGNGTTGVSGVVSASNSLVGAAAGDEIGGCAYCNAVLTNGSNYVISSSSFAGGTGAATWGDGTKGVTGVVSPANSLVGLTPGDNVGLYVLPLENGNYVVESPNFGGGSKDGVGAVTFGNGATGVVGAVSSANSLVGSTAGDKVGSGSIVPLTNGNYVVVSPSWSNGALSAAGAVTFGSGTTGVAGMVSAGNSLVGSHANDSLGLGTNLLNPTNYNFSENTGIVIDECQTTCGTVVPLANGNYVVMSPNFDGGVGAATFASGVTGINGVVNSSNSLLGSRAGDYVSLGGIQPLPGGNYVVMSPLWSFNTGAATFGNGTNGTVGVVSASNSLVGASPGDFVGFVPWLFLGPPVAYQALQPDDVPLGNLTNVNSTSSNIFTTLFSQGGGTGNSVANLVQFNIPSGTPTILPSVPAVLSTGDYMILSPFFDGEMGAATLGSGATGVSGVISVSNSFLGSVPHGYFGSKFQEDQSGFDKTVVSGLVDLGNRATQVELPATVVTIQTNPPGLPFSVDDGPTQTTSTVTLLPGMHTVSVAPTQATGTGTQLAFTSWNDGVTTASRSISVTLSPASFTATFEAQVQLTISASPAAGGTVTPASGGFYNYGTVVPVTASAASGYSFTSWTGSVASGSSSSTTITMSAPQTLVANFTSSGASGHPAFFAGEDFLGGSIYYLQFSDGNLFGYYGYLSSSILYHLDMGYEAFIPSTGSQIYFYDFASGHWWYTSSTLFPSIYDFTLNTFIYYIPDSKNPGHYTTNPRYFSNLSTGQIFTM